MTKIHLDTDIGGDMDDVCALAMLLKMPDVEITGITTVTEDNGRRAGYVKTMLDLVGRSDIPIAAGADVSDGYYRFKPDYPSDEENWGKPVPHVSGSLDDALFLLKRSIEQGAIMVAIGQFTNFALLDKKYPGILKDANLFLMGGHIYEPRDGFPKFGNHNDYNIQLDVDSAKYVLEHANPTLITLTVTCETALRRAYLPRLTQAGKLGQLIVRQAEACERNDNIAAQFAAGCSGLPSDIINFQHDPLACAIALGWREGVEIETVPLRFEVKDTFLHEIPDDNGKPTPIVTKINANIFNEYWVDVMCS
jgi:purine nucleosidase